MRSPLASFLPALLLPGLASAQYWTPIVTPPTAIAVPALANDGVGMVVADLLGPSTFEFSAATSTWTPTSTQPHPLLGAMIGNGTDVLMFGGIDLLLGQMVSDLRRYDRATATWVTLAANGVPPTPRSQSAGASFSPSAAVVVGGTADGATPAPGAQSFLVTVVNPTTAVWVPLPAAFPSRFNACVGAGPGGTAVLFGGTDGVTALGDTWVLAGGVWTQHLGAGPVAAAGGSMAFDPVRAVTVMVNPTGETWEWNGTAWRQVVTDSAPAAVAFAAGLGGVAGAQSTPVTNVFTTSSFTPSAASYTTTLVNATCFAGTAQPFRLQALPGSLPLLGKSLQLQMSQVSPSAFLVGAAEVSTLTVAQAGCNCLLGLTLTGTQVFVPNVGGVGILSIAVPVNLALRGLALDIQGFAFDTAFGCGVAGSDRGTAVVGG